MLVPVAGPLPHLTAAVAVQGMWEQGSPDSWVGVEAGGMAGEDRDLCWVGVEAGGMAGEDRDL